jgi:transcriptional regulator with XRE-family HTH domain
MNKNELLGWLYQVPKTKKNKTKIAEAIKAGITAKGISQYKLAQDVPVSKETVSRWVNRESFVQPDHLVKVGEILSINWQEILK